MSFLRYKECPRFFGFGRNPVRQFTFENWPRAKAAIGRVWQSESCFYSVFQYRYKDGEYYIEIDKIPFDLEHPFKFENPLYEHRRILGLAAHIGGGGYGICTRRGVHSYIGIEPIWLPEKMAKEVLSIAQRKVIAYLGLKTVCWDSLGDVWRLLRLPNSRYQDAVGKLYDIYCVEVHSEDTYLSLLGRRSSRQTLVESVHQRIGLDKLLDFLKEIEVARRVGDKTVFEIDAIKDDSIQLIPQVYIFDKECMRYWLSTGNPPAWVRWYVVPYMKRLGKSIDDIVHFLMGLGMTDFDYGTTYKYVERAFYKYNWVPGHRGIRAKGFCFGPSCPQYKEHLANKDEGKDI
jgi:hypothetical protein